jgi:hypothetical protein
MNVRRIQVLGPPSPFSLSRWEREQRLDSPGTTGDNSANTVAGFSVQTDAEFSLSQRRNDAVELSRKDCEGQGNLG